jgi:hypothetical protein
MLTMLATQNASSTACGAPVRDHSAEMTIFSLTFGGVAYLFFVIRVATRLTTRQRTLYWDDWTMLLTVLISLPPTIFGPLLDSYGIGKDIWTLPFNDITNVLRLFILGELFYMIGMALVKISILFFFLRMFPVKSLQRVIYVVMGICAAYGIAFFLATLFQCWVRSTNIARDHANTYSRFHTAGSSGMANMRVHATTFIFRAGFMRVSTSLSI